MSYRCNERKRTREDNTYRVLDGAAEVEVEVAAVATSIVGSNPVACLVAVCQRHALQGRPGRAFRSLLKTTQLTDNPTLKCPRRSSVSGSTISYISTATPHTGVHTRACACACATPSGAVCAGVGAAPAQPLVQTAYALSAAKSPSGPTSIWPLVPRWPSKVLSACAR